MCGTREIQVEVEIPNPDGFTIFKISLESQYFSKILPSNDFDTNVRFSDKLSASPHALSPINYLNSIGLEYKMI